MKPTLKRLVTASVLTVAMGVVARADVWVGGTGTEFSTAANWNTATSPAAGTTSDISGAFTVERSVDSTSGRTFVRAGATLNVTGGNHNDGLTGSSTFNFVGDGSAGAVNLSGGTYQIGHALRVGGGNASSDGVFNITGGALDVYRGAISAIDSGNPGGRPSLQIGSQNAGSTGLFEVSGGSVITRFGTHLGETGVFSVVGSDTTSIDIGNNSNGDGFWLQRAGGTLKAAVDAGGLTPISINDNGLDGGVFAEFETGSLLDLSFDGIAPVTGTWTVLELVNGDIEWDASTGTGAGGIGGFSGYTLGLALSGTTASGWSFAVDNSGTNGLLTASFVAVPEPSSLALLAFGSLAMIRRRR